MTKITVKNKKSQNSSELPSKPNKSLKNFSNTLLLQATQNSLPEEEMKMRCAVTPHHRNTQYSHTSEYWRQTCSVDEYRILQEIRRNQMNIPTSSGELKEEHLIIAHRIAEMEKRRVGTKFLDRDVTENDMGKGLIEMCSIM